MGAALDELSRHHPTLRPTILEAVNKQLQEAINAGKAFVPPEEEAVNYSFENVENPKTVTNKPMTDLAKVIKVSLSSECSVANVSSWMDYSATRRCVKILSKAGWTSSSRSRTFRASRLRTLAPTCIRPPPHCFGLWGSMTTSNCSTRLTTRSSATLRTQGHCGNPQLPIGRTTRTSRNYPVPPSAFPTSLTSWHQCRSITPGLLLPLCGLSGLLADLHSSLMSHRYIGRHSENMPNSGFHPKLQPTWPLLCWVLTKRQIP